MTRDGATVFADIDAFDPDRFVAHLNWQIYIDVGPVYA
jgi:hypothetical protein